MQIKFFTTAVRTKTLAACLLGALAILSSKLAPPVAVAQEADGEFEGEKTRLDKDGNPHEIRALTSKDKNRRRVMDIIREGKWANDNEEAWVRDWAEYYVRSLTWKDNLANLPGMRKELKKQLINSGKASVGDVHTLLNELTLKVCGEVAKDARYPRAVRFNCMLMIGELDEREHNAGASQQAVPLPAATTLLAETASDSKLRIPLRLAAVVGLKGHVERGIAPALQGAVGDALLGIVQKPVAEGADQKGQAWLRLAASDVLQTMIEKKIAIDQTKLTAALAELLADEKLPAFARARLAGDLGKLDARNMSAAQRGAVVRSLVGLTLAISQASPFTPDESAAEEAEKEAEASKEKASKKGRDLKADNKKAAEKKAAEKKAAEKKAAEKKSPDKKADEKTEKAALDDAAAKEKEKQREEASPATQKLISEEMMWELSQIRLAFIGKEAAGGKDSGPSATNGLYMASEDDAKENIKKIVKHIDEIVKSLAGVPDDVQKVAETLGAAYGDLEDLLSSPAAEPPQPPKTNKPGIGRTRPQGNAPAGASTVSE